MVVTTLNRRHAAASYALMGVADRRLRAGRSQQRIR